MTGDINDLPPGYRQPEHIGSGGWAEVYRCVDQSDGSLVAVKLFHQRLSDPAAGAEGFRQECRTAAMLSRHPGVIGVRAAGVTASARPWLAMELAAGGTLADLIKHSGGALGVKHAIDLTVRLADTMAWAHSLPSPVVHGDLKPANVLLDDSGRPLVSDFGVSGQLGSRQSITLAQFTQTHAAPEVLRDGRASPSSDIWALAAMLFEMLAGVSPFVPKPGEGPGAFIDRVCSGLPADAIPASVPDALAAVIRAGLVVDRAGRTATMSAMATELRAAQSALGHAPTRQEQQLKAGRELPFTTYTEALARTTARPLNLDPAGKPDAPRRGSRSLTIKIGAVTAIAVVAGAGMAFANYASDNTAVPAGQGIDAARVAAPTQSVPKRSGTSTAPSSAASPTGPSNPQANTSPSPRVVVVEPPPPWCARDTVDGVLGTVRRYYASGAKSWTFELGWPADADYPNFRTPGGLFLRTNRHSDSPTGSISPPYSAMTYVQGLPPGDDVNWQEISATDPGNQYSFQSLNPSVDVTSALEALRSLRTTWWSQRNAPQC
ncbi:protein kinase [Catellatospora sp. KI3]|uniref:serine/threonine-protein kinase n=1 Tax=Catellatospora sp. KI3 TaxID=3041620 RepID=UPI0024829CF4|nr:serine/threonine-protein kinase [Catellatospora sp. KI3]MDI1460639.1 protein kinase [Catellatospora sp. KI3]